jgi:hypothetical protein
MVNFHIDKMNNLIIYPKTNSFFKFEIIEFFMIYIWYCHMSSENI